LAEPLLLAIESATSLQSVALLQGKRLLGEITEDAAKRHSERLLAMVDALLRESGVGAADIEAFGVSIGPGSFTSLRVGLATMKGLAFGGEAPAVGVPTLAAMAWGAMRSGAATSGDHRPVASADQPATSARQPAACVLALLDARRGEVYAGGLLVPVGWAPTAIAPGRIADVPAEPLAEALADGLFLPADLGERIAERGLPCVLVGEGAALCGEGVVEASGGLASVIAGGDDLVLPSAVAVAELAAAALARGAGGSAEGLTPRYVRRAEAEATRLQQPTE